MKFRGGKPNVLSVYQTFLYQLDFTGQRLSFPGQVEGTITHCAAFFKGYNLKGVSPLVQLFRP
jgi:hypothetical protein